MACMFLCCLLQREITMPKNKYSLLCLQHCCCQIKLWDELLGFCKGNDWMKKSQKANNTFKGRFLVWSLPKLSLTNVLITLYNSFSKRNKYRFYGTVLVQLNFSERNIISTETTTEYLIFFVCNSTNLGLPNEIIWALTLINTQAISSSKKIHLEF